ncbi:hypothetical protein QS257_19480 [Terrilactibacillus sp. S3-3]|nr:hypothetical protein QS257_19480 [Terrilactibacillus sp. S3-3]
MKHRKKIILLLFVVLMIVPALSACQSGSQSGGSQSSEKTEDPVKQGTIKMEQLNTKLQKAIANKDEAAAQKLGKSLNGQWLSYENGVRDRYPLLYAQMKKISTADLRTIQYENAGSGPNESEQRSIEKTTGRSENGKRNESENL